MSVIVTNAVIVINLATWPNFVTLLRTDALDLYAEATGVEFWDASADSPETVPAADFAIWGHWPRRLGARPARVASELLDRIQHLAEDEVERLGVIMVFDSVDEALRPQPEEAAPADPRAVVDEVYQRLHGSASPELRRVRFTAAIRRGGEDRQAQIKARAASGPGPAGEAPLFDLVVFLHGKGLAGFGERSDAASLAALRVLIDLTRDESDGVRRLTGGSAQGRDRALALTVPVPEGMPSANLRRKLIALIDQALAPRPAGSDQPIIEAVNQVLTEIDELEIAQAVAVVSSVDQRGTPHAPTAELERLWDAPKPAADQDWLSVTGVSGERGAGRLLDESARGIDDFLETRGRRLGVRREALDREVREARERRAGAVEAACIDPSFGLDQSFAGELDRQRERLVARLVGRAAAATSHRARRLALLEGERAAPGRDVLAGPYDGLVGTLRSWLGGRTLLRAYLLLGIGVAALLGPFLIAPVPASTWQFVAAAFLVLAAVGGAWALRRLQRRRDQRRREAIDRIVGRQAEELERIRRISDLGLAQVASARVAGGLVPFVETLRRHARGYERVRGTMSETARLLRAGLRDTGPAGPAPREIGTAGTVPELFRHVLWSHEPAPLHDAVLTFNDQRGDLPFKCALILPRPVEVDVLKPDPGSAPLPLAATAGAS